MCSHPKSIFFPCSPLVKDEVILFPSCLRNNVCYFWKNLLGKNRNLMQREWLLCNGLFIFERSCHKEL